MLPVSSHAWEKAIVRFLYISTVQNVFPYMSEALSKIIFGSPLHDTMMNISAQAKRVKFWQNVFEISNFGNVDLYKQPITRDMTYSLTNLPLPIGVLCS